MRDLDLVRRVMVQDFEHFSEFGFLDPRVAALGDLGLVNMRGEEWRDLKATLSPAFSSKGVKALAGHLDQVRNSSRKTRRKYSIFVQIKGNMQQNSKKECNKKRASAISAVET